MGKRARFSDWEADLVIGAGHKQALVTHARAYVALPHDGPRSIQDSPGGLRYLTPFAHCVHTLTTNNGKEFAQHERIATALNADFYLAHPYASWERGANENMNGLIRQFFPKKMHFDYITVPDIELAMNRLNHRPRKCLGFKTPHEVFIKQLQSHQQVIAPQA